MVPTLAFLVLSAGAGAAQDAGRIEKLIEALDDDSKEERDKAVAELVSIGRPALEALRKAAAGTRSEVKALAAQAIEKIEWGAGADKVRRYVKEHLEENANAEPSKLKSLAKWFPDTRFYEVAHAAPGGGAVVIVAGQQGNRSIFAVRKYEDGFYRLMVKGIVSPDSVRAFLAKQRILLKDSDAALDFSLVFMDLAGLAGGGAAAAVWGLSGGGRIERTDEGWTLHAAASQVTFKVDKDGTLMDVATTSNPYSLWGLSGGDKGSPERDKLEIEKLKLEIEVLKKQLEEAKKKP